jgi:hypothetical protein
MSPDFTACKISLASMNKNISHGQNSSFPSPVLPACYLITLLVGLPESSGGRMRSFPLSTSWFSMLIYRLGDEQ